METTEGGISSTVETLNISDLYNDDFDRVCYNTKMGTKVLTSYQIELMWCSIAVTIGLVVNTLNIVVFTSKNMRVISSNVYLLNLAISDSIFLVAVVLAKITTAIRCLYFPDIRFDIYNTNDVMCRLLQYMLDLCSDYSAMMILAFTVERFIACYYAIRFKELCTVRRAWIACISILIIILLSIVPYHMVCMEVAPVHQVCTVSNHPIKENIFFYAYLCEMVIYRIGPVVIIAVLNVFIIFKILNIHKQRQRRYTITTIKNGGKSTKTSREGKIQLKASKEDKHVQLTVMLIAVSTTYILLLIPNLVYFVLNKFIRMGAVHMDLETELQFYNYSTMFFITAFAVNFFMYTMGGKVFRDELILILFRKKENNNCVKHINKKYAANGKHPSDETEETLI